MLALGLRSLFRHLFCGRPLPLLRITPEGGACVVAHDEQLALLSAACAPGGLPWACDASGVAPRLPIDASDFPELAAPAARPRRSVPPTSWASSQCRSCSRNSGSRCTLRSASRTRRCAPRSQRRSRAPPATSPRRWRPSSPAASSPPPAPATSPRRARLSVCLRRCCWRPSRPRQRQLPPPPSQPPSQRRPPPPPAGPRAAPTPAAARPSRSPSCRRSRSRRPTPTLSGPGAAPPPSSRSARSSARAPRLARTRCSSRSELRSRSPSSSRAGRRGGPPPTSPLRAAEQVSRSLHAGEAARRRVRVDRRVAPPIRGGRGVPVARLARLPVRVVARGEARRRQLRLALPPLASCALSAPSRNPLGTFPAGSPSSRAARCATGATS